MGGLESSVFLGVPGFDLEMEMEMEMEMGMEMGMERKGLCLARIFVPRPLCDATLVLAVLALYPQWGVEVVGIVFFAICCSCWLK